MIFQRSKQNPILRPDQRHEWENLKVYNPAAIYDGGCYHLFYRARGKDWISRIGHAVSEDGEHFRKFNEPFLIGEGSDEILGVEDPHIVKIGDAYFMTYAAYDGDTARLSIAVSKDLKTWEKKGRVFEDWSYTKSLSFFEYLREILRCRFRIRKDWSKAGAVFPEKIDGKYWMLFGDQYIWLANSDDGIRWRPAQRPFLSARSEEYFDSFFIEMGPPPIKTEKGWLALYHGIDKNYTYRIGFLILDKDNPARIIHRSRFAIFEPEELYELSGLVDILPGGYKAMEKMDNVQLNKFIQKNIQKRKMPHVIFCNGAVLSDGVLRIYYGAGDTFVCTATAELSDILALVS